MPVGIFLDALPSALFIGAHVVFLLIGLWGVTKATRDRRPFAGAFWLYVLSQVVFLAFFGGAFTMKMAVLLEQTLVVIMVVWILTGKLTEA